FPLPDASFDFVFSEHMLEHLSYEEGLACLRECRRVLRPGGRIRIATPSLERLARLYDAEQTDVQRRYVRWAADSFVPEAEAALRPRSARTRRTASAKASGDGGSSRSQLWGWGIPMPASSPTSSTVPPLAAYTTGNPHAIASTTRLGQGSSTFVWRSRCARRNRAGASLWAYRPTNSTRSASPRSRRSCCGSETSLPVTISRASASRASVRSASSSRYACVWSPPRRSTGGSVGGAFPGVKRSTSTAL